MARVEEIIKERIYRLEKMKKEYNGNDNGFFQSLIDSQKAELSHLTSQNRRIGK